MNIHVLWIALSTCDLYINYKSSIFHKDHPHFEYSHKLPLDFRPNCHSVMYWEHNDKNTVEYCPGYDVSFADTFLLRRINDSSILYSWRSVLYWKSHRQRQYCHRYLYAIEEYLYMKLPSVLYHILELYKLYTRREICFPNTFVFGQLFFLNIFVT